MLRRNRKVKIVATLGPSSSTPEVIRELFLAGADVFRLNMSHGSHDEIRARHEILRDLEIELGRPICILADLQGPKLRCGTFSNDVETLEEGAPFRFDLDDAPGDADPRATAAPGDLSRRWRSGPPCWSMTARSA